MLRSSKVNPMANTLLVLREEFDDWAILFCPDSGEAYGINPLGVFVWKRLDGFHSEEDILQEVRAACVDVPDDAAAHIAEFIHCLVEKGFVGYELTRVGKP